MGMGNQQLQQRGFGVQSLLHVKAPLAMSSPAQMKVALGTTSSSPMLSLPFLHLSLTHSSFSSCPPGLPPDSSPRGLWFPNPTLTHLDRVWILPEESDSAFTFVFFFFNVSGAPSSPTQTPTTLLDLVHVPVSHGQHDSGKSTHPPGPHFSLCSLFQREVNMKQLRACPTPFGSPS